MLVVAHWQVEMFYGNRDGGRGVTSAFDMYILLTRIENLGAFHHLTNCASFTKSLSPFMGFSFLTITPLLPSPQDILHLRKERHIRSTYTKAKGP